MYNKPMISTTVAAELLEVHPRTLRIYDREGLLCPARSPKNRRLYSQNDIEKGKLIIYITRNLAMNLSGVRVLTGMLEILNVNPSDYMNLIKKVAQKNGVDENENILKTSKRGRKAKIDI